MVSNDKNIRELYIGIGSNLNDPLQQVNNAIEKISNLDRIQQSKSFKSLRKLANGPSRSE